MIDWLKARKRSLISFKVSRTCKALCLRILAGYYTLARRYEFYVRVAKTVSHRWAQRTSDILLLPREHNIHIVGPTRNVFLLRIQKLQKRIEGTNRMWTVISAAGISWLCFLRLTLKKLLSIVLNIWSFFLHFDIFFVILVHLSQRFYVGFSDFNFPIARPLSTGVYQPCSTIARKAVFNTLTSEDWIWKIRRYGPGGINSYEFYEWCIFQLNTCIYMMKSDRIAVFSRVKIIWGVCFPSQQRYFDLKSQFLYVIRDSMVKTLVVLGYS